LLGFRSNFRRRPVGVLKKNNWPAGYGAPVAGE